MKNPFASDLFDPASVTVPVLHQRALDSLTGIADELGDVRFDGSEEGGSVWLSAPRAGFGKSHLLARCQALA
ncbi:MAG: hypothetical protein ABL994_23945, partial [Verrucomicrobiales bacterium]